MANFKRRIKCWLTPKPGASHLTPTPNPTGAFPTAARTTSPRPSSWASLNTHFGITRLSLELIQTSRQRATMPKPMKTKLSAREQLKQNENAMNYWADSFGKPRVDYGVSEKRTQRKSVDGVRSVNGGLLESAVQAQIIEYLRIHPRVKWFARINSGSATGESGAFVRFYRLYLRGMKERATGITDIIGQTDNGCFFVIECKREGVFKATDEQNDFMGCVVGAKGVAQSLGDAVTIIENALTFSR